MYIELQKKTDLCVRFVLGDIFGSTCCYMIEVLLNSR